MGNLNKEESNSGFTALEIVVVLLVAGISIAIATPLITNAMKEYRLNIAAQELVGVMYKAKTTSVSNNQKTAVVIDTGNYRIGLATSFDSSGNGIVLSWQPLPSGITFGQPSNMGSVAPISGAPTSSSISFSAQTTSGGGSSTTLFQQTFNSFGFPNVSAGAVNALYVTNGRSNKAVTLTCVTGLGIYGWKPAGSSGSWNQEY